MDKQYGWVRCSDGMPTEQRTYLLALLNSNKQVVYASSELYWINPERRDDGYYLAPDPKDGAIIPVFLLDNDHQCECTRPENVEIDCSEYYDDYSESSCSNCPYARPYDIVAWFDNPEFKMED